VKGSEGVAGNRFKKYLFKTIRIVAWIAGGLILFSLLLILAVRIPAVQDMVVQRATAYLEDRIGTRVDIGRILVTFPKSIRAEDIYLEDQLGDTLLYAHEMEVNAGLLAFLQRRIAIKDVSLNTARVFISREKPDSAFNYTYIVDAFTEGDEDSIRIEEDDEKAWAISLDDISIDNSFVSYRDGLEETEFTAYLGDLEIIARETNLVDNLYKLKRIGLSNSDIFLALHPDSVQTSEKSGAVDDTTSLPLVLDLKELVLDDVTIRYETPAEHAMVRVGKLEVESRDLNLTGQLIDLKQVTLENTTLSYFIHMQSTIPGELAKDTISSQLEISPWKVIVDNVRLSDNTIQYYDLTDKIRQAGFDPGRIWISNLDANINKIAVEKTTAEAVIEHFRFSERSGLVVKQFQGQFTLSDHEASITRFHGAVNRSTLNVDATVRFPGLNQIEKDLRGISVTISLDRSVIYPSDIDRFFPSSMQGLPITFQSKDRITLAGSLEGAVDDLQLKSFSVDALDSTRLRLTGRIRGLPLTEKASFRLNVEELLTTRTDLDRVLADSLMPRGIVLPSWLRLKGAFSGTSMNPSLDATLTSSDGDISAKGELNLNGKGTYNLLVDARSLALGNLLANKELGNIDLKVKAIGSGKTIEDIDARVNMLLSHLSYKGYDYKDLRVDGRLTRYLFSGAMIMEDENLHFTVKADLDMGAEIPTYVFNLDVKNIDFKALRLTERPLRARAAFDVDLATADFKSVNGRVDIRKVAVFNGAKLYAVDSLLVASIDQVGESSIEIRSDIMTGDFKGTINIFTLPEALRQHFNRYFSLNDSTLKPPTDVQEFTFDLTLKNTELLSEVLLPPLEPFTPGKIYGSFNSEEQNLDIQIKLADFVYGGLSADSISFVVNSDPGALDYEFAVKKIRVDTLRIHDLTFAGTAANDSLHTSLGVLDSLNEKTYLIGGLFTRAREAMRLSLIPGQVILNASEWTVPTNNSLQFGEAGLVAEDFNISKDNQRVAVVTSAKDSLVNLTFNELELGNLTRIISGAVPASGELNGDLKFSTSNSGEFSSKLNITSLSVLQKPWGDLNLTVKHANERYDYDLTIRGNRTTVIASGNYAVVGDSSVVTLAANIPSLNLELVEPFTAGQAKKMEGTLQGRLNLYGTLPAIDIRGDLRFIETQFQAVYLNTLFELKNETISFREEGIVFDDFKILDQAQKPAVLSGTIATSKYQDFNLDLKLSAEDFQVLNTPETRDKPVFGLVKLSLDASVTGPSTHPAVQVKVGMSDDTNVTYLIPESEAGILEQRGIVTFVDKDAINDPFLKTVDPHEGIEQGFKGLDLNAIVELRGRETLNIVIDPETGDKLTVRGRANLNFAVDPSGNMNLSGRYEISDGQYNLSFYKLVKREFEIVKGGTIIWSGDPLRGALDIRALNRVEAAPVELVASQMSSSDESALAPYRQRLPFLVYLNIGGELMVPEISFYLDMPEEKKNVHGGLVYARIQDIDSKEAELNKQVFGLLILRTFVAENPLEGSSGGDLGNTARLSASRMLSEQLNRLSSKIKGVELSLNVKSFEDYSSGESQGRTQAQLGLSKTLFGDRLVVKLSGNVDIEGESQQSNVTDYIGDLALEYKMTTDGRFRLTGFRNSNYDMIDGELTETGAGVIYVKDYNTLRELFKANETTPR
jgi:translocation and assembly module TamB